MYSMHPFGGLASHPYGGSMGGFGAFTPTSLNLPSGVNLGGGSKTAGNVMQLNTNLLKNQLQLFTKLRPQIKQASTLALGMGMTEDMYSVGGEEPSFFEANKTAILVGGGIAVLLAAVLIMRRK